MSWHQSIPAPRGPPRRIHDSASAYPPGQRDRRARSGCAVKPEADTSAFGIPTWQEEPAFRSPASGTYGRALDGPRERDQPSA